MMPPCTSAELSCQSPCKQSFGAAQLCLGGAMTQKDRDALIKSAETRFYHS
jgi:hypothetical protein